MGCGGSSGGGSSNFTSPSGRLVTDNPTGWMDWATLQTVPPDTQMMARICDHGFDVYERPVLLRSTYEEAGDKMALIEPAKNDINGPGDSGSPVLYKGKIVGSIFAGMDSQHLYVRSIEQQMEASRGIGAASKIVVDTAYPELAQKILKHFPTEMASRYLVQRHAVTAGSSVRATTPPVPIAGRKYAATFLDGPDIAEYVMATFTLQLPDGRWLATGHSIGGNGVRALPVSMAYADGRLQDGSIWAHPSGSAFGTLTNDTLHGSVISAAGNLAKYVAAQTDVTLDGVASHRTHQVTLDAGSDDERLSEEYGLVVPLYYAIGLSNAPIYGTATLTLQVEGGEPIVLNYVDDPTNGPLEGPGSSVFLDIDFWVYFALYENLKAGDVVTTLRLDVSLTSGTPPPPPPSARRHR
ncbi:hypothetical protein OP10G_0722 [Fimbriimonas ginsengisoli Gsoil 348]|uniref:Uncharacterized protein n=1 Tax=Fimbriimonas ginsengisoli Gsoil 348 TaxID=661478 RepID=A0A068NMZ3_FIMGI|nr:hypothetical protein OP10G_0722 [Fimbriimonas ginsengisoli Gsoil 348]